MRGTDLCVAHLTRNGRKTLLDDDVTDKLVAILSAGNYTDVACRAVNLSRRTFDSWMTRGKSSAESDARYRNFRERMVEARARGEVHLVAQIARASAESWQAAAFLLERQYPERWGRVSVRMRDDTTQPPDEAQTSSPDDPFTEVDELAQARSKRRIG
jgi:alkanesulfonate monooxygenase SsuD/methylene tetrahydromethanopterin reductase-like flavin-dependent oxidoreductase (luciferase family)